MNLSGNLYAETVNLSPIRPPLVGTETCSVAIVGGGIAGLSTALHLAEAGVDVCVLEANTPGWGASGRNGGQVNPGFKLDPQALLRHFGDDLGKRMIEMAWGAPDFTFNLIRRLGIACDACQSGTMRVAASDRAATAVRGTVSQCLDHGMPVRWLDADQTAEHTGSKRYRAASFDPRGGSLHPLNYSLGLATAAQSSGARIHGGSRVLSMKKALGKWSLITGSG